MCKINRVNWAKFDWIWANLAKDWFIVLFVHLMNLSYSVAFVCMYYNVKVQIWWQLTLKHISNIGLSWQHHCRSHNVLITGIWYNSSDAFLHYLLKGQSAGTIIVCLFGKYFWLFLIEKSGPKRLTWVPIPLSWGGIEFYVLQFIS